VCGTRLKVGSALPARVARYRPRPEPMQSSPPSYAGSAARSSRYQKGRSICAKAARIVVTLIRGDLSAHT
jgi:hypothetical protein